MKIDFDNYEYKEIVKDILNNREFTKNRTMSSS